MPNYAYDCDNCGHQHEEMRSIKAEGRVTCPNCGEADGFRQIFTEPNAIVRGNPKTFGQAAEENARRVGKEQLQIMAEEDKARIRGVNKKKLPKGASLNTTGTGEIPPWRDGSFGIPKMEKPLDIAKVKNLKAYVETGKDGA